MVAHVSRIGTIAILICCLILHFSKYQKPVSTLRSQSVQSFHALNPEEQSYVQTIEIYRQREEEDKQHFMENFDDIQSRSEWDNGGKSQQKLWKLRARERLKRFPKLEKEDMITVKSCELATKDAGSMSGSNITDIYIVSLERRPLKREAAIRQLEKIGLDGTIVNAVDGDGILFQSDLYEKNAGVFPGYVGHNLHNISLTTGEAGCFMSHYSIWRHMHENNISRALILEDDFEILSPTSFANDLKEVLESANQYHPLWDICYLSRYPVAVDHKRLCKNLVIPGFSFWTVAYVLTLNGARKLLNSDGLANMVGLDDWFSLLSQEPIDSACCSPFTDRYRNFFPSNLLRVSVVPPIIMPVKGSFWLSDTATLRKNTKLLKDLPIMDEESRREKESLMNIMPEWDPHLQSKPASYRIENSILNNTHKKKQPVLRNFVDLKVDSEDIVLQLVD